jgi:uncharacterized protein with HEPN domain
MTKDDTVYLKHISDAISKITHYAGKMKRGEFLKNELVQDGIIRQIEIIGEAAKRLSLIFTETHPEIPWKDIIGMRNKLIHDYMGVDTGAVWDTVKKDIPILKKQINTLQ